MKPIHYTTAHCLGAKGASIWSYHAMHAYFYLNIIKLLSFLQIEKVVKQDIYIQVVGTIIFLWSVCLYIDCQFICLLLEDQTLCREVVFFHTKFSHNIWYDQSVL